MKNLVWKTLIMIVWPERFLNVPRKVLSKNTVWLKIELPWTTETSELAFVPKARYSIHIEDWKELLTIYGEWSRPLTEQEKYILTEGKKLAMIERFWSEEKYIDACHYDAMTDCSTTYYAEKYYFEKMDATYLTSSTKTKRLDRGYNWSDINTWRIFENTLQGEKELEYIIS